MKRPVAATPLVAPCPLERPPLAWLVGVALLGLGGCETITSQFGGGPSFVVLEDAHGIAIGNQVRVHGVNVGRVTEVSVVPEGARVVFDLSAADALRSDACASVRREGLMGEAFLHVEAGHAEAPWAPPLAACEETSIDQTLTSAAALLGELRLYVAALERGERTLCHVERADDRTPRDTTPAAPATSPTPADVPAEAPADAIDAPAPATPAAETSPEDVP